MNTILLSTCLSLALSDGASALATDLAAVPGDAALFGSIRIADLLQTPALRRWLGRGWEDPSKLADEVKEAWGLTLSELERITAVYLDGQLVFLVRNRQPLRRDPIVAKLAPGSTEQQRRGYRYYLDEKWWNCLVFLDERTFLFGRPENADRLLFQTQRERTPRVEAALRLVQAGKHHAVLAGDLMALQPVLQRFAASFPPDEYQHLLSLLRARSALLTMDYSSDLTAGLRLDFMRPRLALRGECALSATSESLLDRFWRVTVTDPLPDSPTFGEEWQDLGYIFLKKLTTRQDKEVVTARVEVLGKSVIYHTLPWKADWHEPGPVTQNLDIARGLYRLGRAMRAYHRDHGRLPPRAVFDSKGKALLSWRVLLLPYLGEMELFRQFRLDEPWDSEPNRRLIARMPSLFASRRMRWETPVTSFCVFHGPGTPFEGTEGLRLEDFRDGLAETILVAEAPLSIPWTKPADLDRTDRKLTLASRRPAWDDSPKGVMVVCADGTVRAVQNFQPMITRSGSENVDLGKTSRIAGASQVPPDQEPEAIPSLRTRLQGHQRMINAVAFSPDGKKVATASADETARLWDVATGQPLATLIGHERSCIHGVAFSPDGKMLATGEGKILRLWDVASGKGIGSTQNQANNRDMAGFLRFSPDGRRVASISQVQNRNVLLWDAQLWCRGEMRRLESWGHNTTLAFSPDGQTVATPSGCGVKLHDTAARNAVIGSFGDPVWSDEKETRGLIAVALAFARDGKSLLAAY